MWSCRCLCSKADAPNDDVAGHEEVIEELQPVGRKRQSAAALLRQEKEDAQEEGKCFGNLWRSQIRLSTEIQS